MKNIAVIFGGKSVEHDISIITGLQVIANMHRTYNVLPIYISREGEWLTGEKLIMMSSFINFSKSGLSKCWLIPHSKELHIKKFMKIKKIKVDNAILALHGVNGEDGSVQGLLQLCEIPFSSAGVMGSAITMDKVLCKKVLLAEGINTPNFYNFYADEWKKNKTSILKIIKEKFNNKVVIKPARAGSSIGVAKCGNQSEVKKAVEVALCFDNKIIVEESIADFREINIACMGLENNVQVSSLEEIKGAENILDFDKKYVDRNSVERVVDVKLEDDIKAKIENMAKSAFTLCECMGIVRMDFFVENKTNKIWLNEINSIPGSMANYLWKGQKFGELLDKLLALGECRQERREQLTYLYESQTLANFNAIPNGKMYK